MKKIVIAAGLLSLAACSGPANNTAQENLADAHEANADYYQNLADSSANAIVANEATAADASEANATDLPANGD